MQTQLRKVSENAHATKEDLEYIRKRFGKDFVTKIEKTLKNVDNLNYQVEEFRMET